MPWVEKPYTFEEIAARFEAKQLTWKEYLHELFLHCLLEWHQDVNLRPLLKSRLMVKDLFAFTVWCYHDKILDVTPRQIESIFHASAGGALEDVSARLDSLSKQTRRYICASLALWALQTRKLDLLKLTIDHSAMMDGEYFYPARAFKGMVDRIKREDEPDLVDLLATTNWRRKFEWKPEGYVEGMGLDILKHKM